MEREYHTASYAIDNGERIEPEGATGIAWLEYMAYVQFQDPRYLAAADTCMSQMDVRIPNPFYETLAFDCSYQFDLLVEESLSKQTIYILLKR